jgi:hypothetical protein
MKKIVFFVLAFMIIFLAAGVHAELNDTTNQTIPDIILNDFMPKEVQMGDVQFNLQIENNKNETITNIFAFISGRGFSTYDIVPIDSLPQGEKSFIFISGNVKQAGNISLTIRINDETFYQNITVIDPVNETAQKLEELRLAQEKEQQIQNISEQLDKLKIDLKNLEEDLTEKGNNDYDVSGIKLDYLKNYVRSIQADILTGNVNDGRVNLNLAAEEYASLKESLDSTKKIPFINKLKDYALIFSTIAGSIITLFALYELLKKKREHITETITEKIKKDKEKKKRKE